mgnify:CR=1 FL=1
MHNKILLFGNIVGYSVRLTRRQAIFVRSIMERVSIKHHLEYSLLRLLVALVRNLPRRPALALGRFAGRCAPFFLRQRLQLARDNMRLALPELSAAEVNQLALRNFEHMGLTAVDAVRLDLLDPARMDALFDLTGTEHLREAMDLGRGVILLTAHLGFWEAGSYVFPALGVRLDTIAKPLKNPLSEQYFQGIRRHYGAEVLNSRKGARRIFKSLQAGRAVGVLLDQHISPPGSVAVDFFGRKAFTTTAITSMAMKHRIPIVPTFCLRRPDNRYRAWIEPMVLLEGAGDDAVAANTQQLTSIIEDAIRQDPAQWFWVHRRWRDRKTKRRRRKRAAVATTTKD